ncbi:hypothetical protein X733_28495 [Mesorhizobium sp. L2C067A000]|nr:hypothetical protein X733_28495 [Mesorhizobium sp. L2C067A000]
MILIILVVALFVAKVSRGKSLERFGFWMVEGDRHERNEHRWRFVAAAS